MNHFAPDVERVKAKVMYAVLGIPVQPHFHGPSFRFGNTGFAMLRYLPVRHQWRMMRLESPP